MKKKKIVYVLWGAIGLVVLGTAVAYGVLKPDRPWMALFVACCGGVLVFNFLLSLFLINKNFKK